MKKSVVAVLACFATFAPLCAVAVIARAEEILEEATPLTSLAETAGATFASHWAAVVCLLAVAVLLGGVLLDRREERHRN